MNQLPHTERIARLLTRGNTAEAARVHIERGGKSPLPEPAFALANPPPKPEPWRGEPAPQCRQKVLLTGADCLAGQEDLFVT